MQNSQVLDADERLVASIQRVEVGRRMVIERTCG